MAEGWAADLEGEEETCCAHHFNFETNSTISSVSQNLRP